MAVYPDISSINLPYILEPEFSTLISNFDGGQEQRRSKQLFPVYNVTIQYKYLSLSDAKTLYEFYMEMKGMYESFYLFDYTENMFHTFTHFEQYCATADGILDIFDIPGKSTSSQTVYIDGVDESNYVILGGGGNADSDRVDFITAPAAGSIITADFSGYLRMKVRFANDKLARTNITSDLYTYSINLKGLRGE